MSQPIEKLAADLHFVREAVKTSHTVQYRSVAIPVLWAVVIAVGFALNDFILSPVVGWYWALAPAAAGVLSGWLGQRAEQSAGVQSDRRLGRRIALHWLATLMGMSAVLVITVTHDLGMALAGQLLTLVFGIVYFLGGLHLDGRFLWPGLAAIAGSAAIGQIGPYSWTIVGAVIAGALIASALWTKGGHVQGPSHS
ncbi:MAG TPA: hypothetical protein VNX28_17780 [Gemmataceae bacterium]|nr:hypothetical protein [Gemmataceae bacterium]